MELIYKNAASSRRAFLAVAGVSLLVILNIVGALVRIPLPFTPVPFTLQVFFVLLGASFLGARKAGLAQILYVVIGSLGLPVFSGAGSGFLYLAGPTAGYLYGFFLAALFCGFCIKFTHNKFHRVVLLFLISEAILLISGALWLVNSLKVSFTQGVLLGIIPFIPGDFLKILSAAAIYSCFGRKNSK
ncbi:MAG: biotin transporter BioY [Candidatus Omnitrophica bacterium]|jgi:biotin transport system substrate-specific component|nr:biotin transporter BioY [Candidatus Omnitrophota bacterium]